MQGVTLGAAACATGLGALLGLELQHAARRVVLLQPWVPVAACQDGGSDKLNPHPALN